MKQQVEHTKQVQEQEQTKRAQEQEQTKRVQEQEQTKQMEIELEFAKLDQNGENSRQRERIQMLERARLEPLHKRARRGGPSQRYFERNGTFK